MILRRLLFYLAGAAALSASAGIVMVALAYALYALVKPELGPAGASAVVAGAAAAMIGLIALALILMSRPKKPKKKSEPEGFAERVADFIRSKPVTAIGAAIAAGVLAIRNPSYLGVALRAFLDTEEPPKRRRR